MNKNQEFQMYVTNLLVETLPKSQRTDAVLHKLDIHGEQRYILAQLVLSRSMKNTINSKTEEEAIVWKSDFHDLLGKELTNEYVEVISILNLQPIVRTIVIRLSNDLSEEESLEELSKVFQQLNTTLVRLYGTKVIGCYGSIVNDFFLLGRSYKKARELQEYHYIVGLGRCAFYDGFIAEDQVSLVEYKFLHLFEELLHKDDWLSLGELLTTIKDSVIKNRINDSKTMYIYKEVFSSTIRYLFDQSESYTEEIEKLNRGIIKFEHLFDDVEEIHVYYMSVFSSISESELYKHINPHIRKALSTIHKKYMEVVSLQSVSSELQISEEYLSRLFKAEMDCNFKQYLTSYRLTKAKELLVETSKDINYIRSAVGYQSPTQFVRAFKSFEGITPSKYRKYNKSK